MTLDVDDAFRCAHFPHRENEHLFGLEIGARIRTDLNLGSRLMEEVVQWNHGCIIFRGFFCPLFHNGPRHGPVGYDIRT